MTRLLLKCGTLNRVNLSIDRYGIRQARQELMSALCPTDQPIDPTRNPAPLPLPDHHAPVSLVRTQTKISAAHRKLGTASSSRSLSQMAQEPEQSAPGIYELVFTIHTNLELLMKRSQNNARDLGKLRGDVRHPLAIEEIKKILQESSVMHPGNDVQDPDRKQQMDADVAMKLDALLKLSAVPPDRPSTASPVIATDHLASAQSVSMLKDDLFQAYDNLRSTIERHLPVELPVPETDPALLSALNSIQSTLNTHLPVVIPEPVPVVQLSQVPQEPPEPVKISLDTSELEAVLSSLCTQINEKSLTLQNLDATLLLRNTELASLESRSVALQNTVNTMMSQLAAARTEETQRREESAEQRVIKTATLMRKKKSKRELVPLAPTADRRIVSLSNVPSSPSRKTTPQPKAPDSPAVAAAPLRRDSPFLQQSISKPDSIQLVTTESKSSHRLQTTLRTSDERKSSWGRRVSQLFLAGAQNKENPATWVVDKDVSKNFGFSDTGTDGIGRGHPNRNSMRSFRSFSHRV